jgi:hypothetical protein
LYYTITGPDNTIRATHQTSVPTLDPYHTLTDQWSVNNAGWPAGDYTVSICWSTGNATNCDIAGPITTTFHSVPTLGWWLGLAGLAILVYAIWRRRAVFVPVPAGGTR